MWELLVMAVGAAVGGPIGFVTGAVATASLGGSIVAQRLAPMPAMVPVLGPMVAMSGVKMDGPFVFTPAQYSWLTRVLRSAIDTNTQASRSIFRSLVSVGVMEEMTSAGWAEDADPTLYMLALGRKQVQGLSPKERESYGIA